MQSLSANLKKTKIVGKTKKSSGSEIPFLKMRLFLVWDYDGSGTRILPHGISRQLSWQKWMKNSAVVSNVN